MAIKTYHPASRLPFELGVSDANLIPSNIKQGTSLFGVIGTLVPGTPFASGTATSSSTTSSFTRDAGTTINFYTLTISGLSFTPTKIIAVHYDATNSVSFTMVDMSDAMGANANTHIAVVNSSGVTFIQAVSPAVIGTNCTIPMYSASLSYNWYAYA